MAGQRYVPSNLSEGNWYREGARQTHDNSLNDLMQVDHVIRVDAKGLVWDDVEGVWAPEVNPDVDDDGSFTADTERLIDEEVKRQGWYRPGRIIDPSHFVGGSMAEEILSTPGYWVVCAVETESAECPNESPTCVLSDPCVICYDGTGEQREREDAGWVLLHRESV